MTQKVAAATEKLHAKCQQTSVVPQDPEKLIAAQTEIAPRSKAEVAQRKRRDQLEAENGLLKRKLGDAKVRDVHVTVEKRLKTARPRSIGGGSRK